MVYYKELSFLPVNMKILILDTVTPSLCSSACIYKVSLGFILFMNSHLEEGEEEEDRYSLPSDDLSCVLLPNSAEDTFLSTHRSVEVHRVRSLAEQYHKHIEMR